MEERLNIYQKLSQIRKPLEILQKDKNGYNYSYVSPVEIAAKTNGLMRRYGVSLVPEIEPQTLIVTPITYTKRKFSKTGDPIEEIINETLVQADMKFHWVNDENPEERITVPWVITGQQADASQALGSALTYGTRYFLLKYFNVATSDDDPDDIRSRQKEAEHFEEIEVAKSIAAEVDKKAHEILDKYPESEKDVVTIVKKFVKVNGKTSANYLACQDSEALAHALEDLTKYFNSKENK